jgi:putative SOS response-associated peptidase YedK
MCGRFTLTADLKSVAERFGAPASDVETPVPRYNIAPTQGVIVVNDEGRRQLRQMRWGLIPSWAKEAAIGNKLINARAETLTEKPSFREALKKRRCLIPADGFYEWQKLGKLKQPMRIVLKSREPFGFAGLWDVWENSEGDEIRTCTIITTAANELLREIHTRMPVILTREDEALWLDPKIQDPAVLLPLLKQYPAELMEFYPVSTQVNTATIDQPENIARCEPEKPTGLLPL